MGTKFNSIGSGHMTKMTATPSYGKNPCNLLLQKQKAGVLGTWYVEFGDVGPTKFIQMVLD